MSAAFPGLPPAPPPTEPVVATAVILWRDGPATGTGGGLTTGGRELMLVRRGVERRFAGGFHAFPGGRLDAGDGDVAVEGARDEAARLVACAARELFEETGVLAVPGAAAVPRARRCEVRRALLAGELTFAGALGRLGLALSAEPFAPAGRWVTPEHLPLRYDAHLFAVRLPPGESPEVWPGELAGGAMMSARAALERWARGEMLLYPPNLHGVRTLAREGDLDLAALRTPPPEATERAEFQQGFFQLPLRTPTLPPATHTNGWVVPCGDGVALVDPGADDPAEQALLFAALAGLGHALREVWLTHAHPDHVGSVEAVVRRLHVPVRAHPLAQDRVPVPIEAVREGRLLGGRFRVLETPGHAREHLCFLDEETGALLAGDMVSTLSTIVIDPPEGDMAEYERQLERLRALAPRTVYPAHGPPAPDGAGALARYREHRRAREQLVVEALEAGGGTLEEVTARAYADTPAVIHPVAARSCLAVLEKLRRAGHARLASGVWTRAIRASGTGG